MSKKTEIQWLEEQLQEREWQLPRQKLSKLAAADDAHSVGGLCNLTATERVHANLKWRD